MHPVSQRLSGWAVFDLDGTLADSLSDISLALSRVLKKHFRKPISKHETKQLIGKGPRTLIERAWLATGNPASEEQARALTADYLMEYRTNPKGEIGRAHV